jgi:hypothetical protein
MKGWVLGILDGYVLKNFGEGFEGIFEGLGNTFIIR